MIWRLNIRCLSDDALVRGPYEVNENQLERKKLELLKDTSTGDYLKVTGPFTNGKKA